VACAHILLTVRGTAFGKRFGSLEDGIVFIIAMGLTAIYEWDILAGRYVFETDARIHEFWMYRFQDAELFRDPLTRSLISTGYIPLGVQTLGRVVSWFLDPVSFSERLPLILAPVSALLVFRIVRLHVEWKPAAWLGAALFVLPWDLHYFSGGHSRAWNEPMVLGVLYLLLRGRERLAVLVPAVGSLLYPPGAIFAVALFSVSSINLRNRLWLNRPRAVLACVAGALTAVGLLLPRVLGYASGDIISRAEALRDPVFGPEGQMHFFRTSLLEMLKAGYSGFRLLESGSVLAVTFLVLYVLRPSLSRLLRWEIWAMGLSSLLLFVLAYATLFHLYLPHRYTQPLVAFFAISIAVGW
jgi:hypothetical protein